ELFEWLRNLSFMEQSAEGLFPHDLAREVLDTDFRWRDPDGYQEMHRRVWRYLRQKLLWSHGPARQQGFFGKVFTHRASPTGSRYHDYTTLGMIYGQTATKAEHEAIIQNVRRWEGPESAGIAEHWLSVQPQAFRVVHGPRDEMLGFVASIVLPSESA